MVPVATVAVVAVYAVIVAVYAVVVTVSDVVAVVIFVPAGAVPAADNRPSITPWNAVERK